MIRSAYKKRYIKINMFIIYYMNQWVYCQEYMIENIFTPTILDAFEEKSNKTIDFYCSFLNKY